MKQKRLRNALAAGILAIATGYAVQASAAFTFTEYGGFNDNDPGAANPSNIIDYSGGPCSDVNLCPQVAGSQIWSTMSWISGSTPQSSLVLTTVTGPAPLPSDGTWTTISTLTHNNVIIPSATNWSDQDVWGRLKISDEGGVVLDNSDPINLDFTETTNFPTLPQCSPPNPQGSACDDFFLFTASGLDPIIFFDSNGGKWMVEFQLANLTNATLLFVTCAEDPINGCPAVFTGESVSSHLDVQARLTFIPQEVPEPSVLTLLGLGLLGLGFSSRRRAKGNMA